MLAMLFSFRTTSFITVTLAAFTYAVGCSPKEHQVDSSNVLWAEGGCSTSNGSWVTPEREQKAAQISESVEDALKELNRNNAAVPISGIKRKITITLSGSSRCIDGDDFYSVMMDELFVTSIPVPRGRNGAILRARFAQLMAAAEHFEALQKAYLAFDADVEEFRRQYTGMLNIGQRYQRDSTYPLIDDHGNQLVGFGTDKCESVTLENGQKTAVFSSGGNDYKFDVSVAPFRFIPGAVYRVFYKKGDLKNAVNIQQHGAFVEAIDYIEKVIRVICPNQYQAFKASSERR